MYTYKGYQKGKIGRSSKKPSLFWKNSAFTRNTTNNDDGTTRDKNVIIIMVRLITRRRETAAQVNIHSEF